MYKKLKKICIFIAIIFLILIASLFYWKYPFKQQNHNWEKLKYEEIINKINKRKSTNLYEAEDFIIQNKNIYGTLMALNLAKKYILHNNFAKALIQLETSLNYTKEENLKNILKLRIAKLKIQTGQNKCAINILNSIQNNHWKNIVNNMQGDIFAKQNNRKLAIQFWEKSLSLEDSKAFKEIIKMKINELKK